MINRSCTVNHASSTKTFTFDYFSNSKFSEFEYNEWVTKCQASNVSTPPKKFANQRAVQLKQMAETEVTDSLINEILKRKSLFCLSTTKRDPTEASDHNVEESKVPKKPKPATSYISFAKTTQDPSKSSSFDPFSRRKCRPSQIQAFSMPHAAETQPPGDNKATDFHDNKADDKSTSRNIHENIDLDI